MADIRLDNIGYYGRDWYILNWYIRPAAPPHTAWWVISPHIKPCKGPQTFININGKLRYTETSICAAEEGGCFFSRLSAKRALETYLRRESSKAEQTHAPTLEEIIDIVKPPILNTGFPESEYRRKITQLKGRKMIKKALHRITIIWCLYGLARLCILLNPLVFRAVQIVKPLYHKSSVSLKYNIPWDSGSIRQIITVWFVTALAVGALLAALAGIHAFANWFFNTGKSS